MKKFISILLAVMLVASLVVTASAYSVYPDALTTEEGVAAYEADTGEEVETHRYFFQMPNGKNGPLATKDVTYLETDAETGEEREVLVCKEGDHAPSWCNEYNGNGAMAGIYWWGGAALPGAWAGYQSMVEDAEHGIFYADVPVSTVVFVWNNGIDGGMDKTDPIYYMAQQSSDVGCEYPDPGEFDTIPDGADSYDGMIFVILPDEVAVNPLSLKQTCGGTWYYYYGNGCYGSYPEGEGDDTCKNIDHYDAEGNHVGWQDSGEDPTEPPLPQVLRGDYDKDDQITIMDATRAQNIIAELYVEEDTDFLTAVDADGDGELNILDATRVQNVIAELMNMDGSKPFVPAA